jgi:hypothetical protein
MFSKARGEQEKDLQQLNKSKNKFIHSFINHLVHYLGMRTHGLPTLRHRRGMPIPMFAVNRAMRPGSIRQHGAMFALGALHLQLISVVAPRGILIQDKED